MCDCLDVCAADCKRCGLVTETVERVVRDMGLFRFPKNGVWGVLDRCDLYQSGMIGLLGAIAKWNPDGRARFTSYAVGGVRQAVKNAIRAASGSPRRMRLPKRHRLTPHDYEHAARVF